MQVGQNMGGVQGPVLGPLVGPLDGGPGISGILACFNIIGLIYALSVEHIKQTYDAKLLSFCITARLGS